LRKFFWSRCDGRHGSFFKAVDIAYGHGSLAWAFFRFTRLIVRGPVYKYVKRSKATWDDLLMDNNVFTSLAHIVPVIIIRVVAPILFQDFEGILPFVVQLTEIYTIVVILMIINALLR